MKRTWRELWWLSALLPLWPALMAAQVQPCSTSPCSVPAGTSFSVAGDHNGQYASAFKLQEDGSVIQTKPVSALANGTIAFTLPLGLPAGTSHNYRLITVGVDNPVTEAISGVLTVTATTAQPPPPSSTNLALNKAATANDTSAPTTTYAPGKAVDGNGTTFWAPNCCGSGANWWQVDLGATYDVARVKSTWIAPRYPRTYQIQGSLNGSTWTTIQSLTNQDGGIDDVTIPTTSARYMRLNLQQYGGGEAGYYLAEVEVYGGSTTPPPAALTVACPPNVTATSPNGQPVAIALPLGTVSGGTAPYAQALNPASGSLLPLGPSTITLNASDSSVPVQTASCTYTATVTYTPATLTLIAPPQQNVTSPDGNPVVITSLPRATVTGGTLPYLPQALTPGDGSAFAVGRTSVLVTQTDSGVPPQTKTTTFDVLVSYTPPPPVQTGSLTITVKDCTITATSSAPPDSQTGWGVQFQRKLTTATSWTNLGSRDTTAPYQQTSGTLALGDYQVQGIWTRTGSASVTQVLGQKTCGGVLP